MKKRNTTIVATRILIMNERYSIRHFFTNRRIQDKYAIKKATPSPIFIKIIVKFRELGRGGHKESGDNVHSYSRAPSMIDADKCQVPRLHHVYRVEGRLNQPKQKGASDGIQTKDRVHMSNT
jgi:hypothetical protein